VITGDKARFTTTRATVNTMDVKRTDPDDSVVVTIYMDSIDMNRAFRVSNVYYDFNKATLRSESMGSLDSLVYFMKDNPSLSVDIYSFADAIGNEQYNVKLSQERAQSVMNYLERNGVGSNRMRAKGMGETHPVAPNTKANGKDNPAGRQANRRTELRIVAEDPTRRVIFDSSKPGTIGEQEKNLSINPDKYDDNDNDKEPDTDSGFGEPGSRVNKQ
jgi:outer membrane protein OmpA-like peptidoglycan-associated protein